MMKIIYPQRIKKGGLFGITATSMGIHGDRHINRLDKAISNIKGLGYECIETNNVRTNNKLVSSDGLTRSREFLNLWNNNDVSWIINVYGG